MSIVYICILFLGISLCLAFVGLSYGLFGRFSLRFLHLFLLLEAFNLTFEWLLAHPGSPYKSAWFALMMWSSFLMAPCVWLLAREIHENSTPKVRPLAWGQLAVIALGFFLLVPLALSAHGGTLLVDPSVPPTPLFAYIHIGMVAAVLVYLVQVPWYLSKCLALFRERVRLDEFLFSSHSEPGLSTLRALSWVMVASWVLSLSRTCRAMYFPWSPLWDTIFSVFEIGVMICALYVILKRFWQYSEEDQKLLDSIRPDWSSAGESSDVEKYAKSALDEPTHQRILKKVNAQFSDKKIFKNNDLKLKTLCDAINERPHYVSQVINQGLKRSFYDLVNYYRIEAAKQALVEQRDKSILNISLEVGFNSKSHFNKTFKETTGVTPSEYRNNRNSSRP